MLFTAIALFSIAAVLGMLLLSYVLTDKPTPKGLAFIHGPIAILGIALLIYYTIVKSPGPIESLLLFIIAALGGFVLIFRDLTGKTIPKWLAILHGLIAVSAFLLLLFFVFSHGNVLR